MKRQSEKKDKFCVRCGMKRLLSTRGICSDCRRIAITHGQEITTLKLILKIRGGEHEV
jgi:hypothetical protein